MRRRVDDARLQSKRGAALIEVGYLISLGPRTTEAHRRIARAGRSAGLTHSVRVGSPAVAASGISIGARVRYRREERERIYPYRHA